MFCRNRIVHVGAGRVSVPGVQRKGRNTAEEFGHHELRHQRRHLRRTKIHSRAHGFQREYRNFLTRGGQCVCDDGRRKTIKPIELIRQEKLKTYFDGNLA